MGYNFWNMGYDVVGDLAVSQANAFASYNYNKNLMSYQNDLNKDYASWNYNNASSMQRAGLEKAGYNPILAINSGTNFVGGSSGNSSVNVSDSHTFSNARQNSIANKQTSIAERSQQSQASLNLTQEDVNNATQVKLGADTNTEWYKQQNLESQTALNNINTELLNTDLPYRERLNLMNIKTGYINAQANLLSGQSSVTNAQAAMINARSNEKYNKRRAGGYSRTFNGGIGPVKGGYTISW